MHARRSSSTGDLPGDEIGYKSIPDFLPDRPTTVMPGFYRGDPSMNWRSRPTDLPGRNPIFGKEIASGLSQRIGFIFVQREGLR